MKGYKRYKCESCVTGGGSPCYCHVPEEDDAVPTYCLVDNLSADEVTWELSPETECSHAWAWVTHPHGVGTMKYCLKCGVKEV